MVMISPDAPPNPLVPRDYQVEGIAFLRDNMRAMNRDKPGLGKTLQAAYAAEAPVLVLCPNYLVEQWVDWLCGFDDASLRRAYQVAQTTWQVPEQMPDYLVWATPRPNVEGTVGWCVGDYWKKKNVLDAQCDWTVGNHEMLSTHKDWFDDLPDGYFKTLIIDESHHLRNHTSARSRVADKIARKIERIYELTGTPIWKEADDLYMQLHLLAPEIFSSYTKFVDLFCIAESGRFGTKVLGVKKEMLPELDEILNIMTMGRTYKEAGRQLPQAIPHTVKVQFPPDLQRIYDDAVDQWAIQLEDESVVFDNYSQVMNVLRQITAFPGKIEAAEQILEDAPNDKAVIFCWYRETADRVHRYIKDSVLVDGTVPIVERRRRALSGKVVVCTIAALAEGIDLSDVRTVIYIEEHWPPGSEEQSLGRIQRDRDSKKQPNQDPIQVHYVHVKGTIDEHIHRVKGRRFVSMREIIREVVLGE